MNNEGDIAILNVIKQHLECILLVSHGILQKYAKTIILTNKEGV